MQRIANTSADSLLQFVEDSLEPGSVVHAYGWVGYLPLESKHYEHINSDAVFFFVFGNVNLCERDLLPQVGDLPSINHKLYWLWEPDKCKLWHRPNQGMRAIS